MSLAEAQLLLQSISALAAAGGLIYFVLELRGWRTAQYVANFTKLVELQLGLRRMRMDDPSLVTQDSDTALASYPPEKVRIYFYYLMQVSLFEVAWFSHHQGQLPDDYFQSWVNSIRQLIHHPGFRFMWETETTKIMHGEFRRYLDQLMAEVRFTETAEPTRPVTLE